MEKMTDGSDLIFATGVPGSRWSRILGILSIHGDINSSDKIKFPTYNTEVTFPNGKTKKVGMHSSAYFGPGTGIGEDFHLLKKTTKEAFLQEVSTAFENFDSGIKIIKSHWFCYNLDWLKENFPKAKFIFVYNGNEEAFKWWHLVGGWNIKFPKYTWYENNERLYERIIVENELMLDFMKKNNVIFDIRNFRDFLARLGMEEDPDFFKKLQESSVEFVDKGLMRNRALRRDYDNIDIGTWVGVYNPGQPNKDKKDLDESIKQINIKVKRKHENMGVDEVLINTYGQDWYNTIQNIIDSGDRTHEN
jgi:hypothetical protein